MASAFKWRLTETLFSYLTDVSGDTPQINSGYTTDIESIISAKVATEFASEQAYSAQFRRMTDIIAIDPSTSGITLLNYSYYYDMNDNSCGFLNGSVGSKGEKGDKGDKGDNGDNGKDGVGIDKIETEDLYSNGTKIGTRVIFKFTDPNVPDKTFDVMNGRDGATQHVDYNYILSSVTNLGLPEQIINTIVIDLYPELQEYFNQIYLGALADINAIKRALSGLTRDVGGLRFDVDYVSGQTGVLAQYYDADQMALNTINARLSAVSGVAYINMSRIDALNSGVTRVGQEMNVMSGYIRNYVEDIRILDEATCAFTRDISQIYQTARYIEHTVESISGDVRNLSDQVQTASSMTTTISHQVSGILTDVSYLSQTYSSLTSQIEHLSGDVHDISVVAQTACSLTVNLRHEVCGVTQNFADLEVDYNHFKSQIGQVSGDFITYSEIVQAVTAITATVYDEIYDRTGIDIRAGSITLDADKTTITGSLTLSAPNDGILFTDVSGNTKIGLSTEYLPNLENYNMGIQTRKGKLWTTQQITTYPIAFVTNINNKELGEYSTGQRVHIDYLYLKMYFEDAVFDNRIDHVEYNVAIIQNSTIIGTHSGTCTRESDGLDYFYSGEMDTTVTGNGMVTINMEIISTNKTSASAKTGRWTTVCDILYQKIEVAQTTLRLNGLATFQDTTHFAWLGPDQSAFRQGESTLRIKDGRIERNILNADHDPIYNGVSDRFVDISTCVPYNIINALTHTASTVNDGLIIFNSVIGSSDGDQRTLLLPDPNGYQGKILYVKNIIGGNTKVRTIDSNRYILPYNSNSEQREISIGANSTILISDGFEWIQFY